MVKLHELSAKVLALRSEIDILLANDNYEVEELAEKTAILNTLINMMPHDKTENEAYPLFLTDNLQWLNTVIARITIEKKAIANSILQTQRRKKAQKSYDENK